MDAATVPEGMPPWAWLAALIITVVIGPTVLAWMNHRQGQRIQRQNERIRNQVENDHSSNLRDEMDERHGAIMDRLDRLAETDEQTSECIRNIDRSLRSLDRRTKRIGEEVRADRDDLDELRAAHWAEKRRTDAHIAKHHPEEE